METNSAESQQILLALRKIGRAVALHSHSLAQEFGITVPQLLTLQEAARLHRALPSSLSRETQISRSTMTGILKRLEERSLITRVPDREDRRRSPVRVTERGAALLQKYPSILQEAFGRRLAALASWERTSLLAAVQRIASMMEPETLASREPEPEG